MRKLRCKEVKLCCFWIYHIFVEIIRKCFKPPLGGGRGRKFQIHFKYIISSPPPATMESIWYLIVLSALPCVEVNCAAFEFTTSFYTWKPKLRSKDHTALTSSTLWYTNKIIAFAKFKNSVAKKENHWLIWWILPEHQLGIRLSLRCGRLQTGPHTTPFPWPPPFTMWLHNSLIRSGSCGPVPWIWLLEELWTIKCCWSASLDVRRPCSFCSLLEHYELQWGPVTF